MGAIWGHLWWAGVGETPVSQDCLPPPEVIVQGCSPLGHLHQHGTSFLPASSLAASPAPSFWSILAALGQVSKLPVPQGQLSPASRVRGQL